MDNKPGSADYILAVMKQVLENTVDESEMTLEERKRLDELNHETVTSQYMTSREWEMLL